MFECLLLQSQCQISIRRERTLQSLLRPQRPDRGGQAGPAEDIGGQGEAVGHGYGHHGRRLLGLHGTSRLGLHGQSGIRKIMRLLPLPPCQPY